MDPVQVAAEPAAPRRLFHTSAGGRTSSGLVPQIRVQKTNQPSPAEPSPDRQTGNKTRSRFPGGSRIRAALGGVPSAACRLPALRSNQKDNDRSRQAAQITYLLRAGLQNVPHSVSVWIYNHRVGWG